MLSLPALLRGSYLKHGYWCTTITFTVTFDLVVDPMVGKWMTLLMDFWVRTSCIYDETLPGPRLR